MATQQQDQGVPADLLKRAAQAPKGVKLEDYNPLETIPTLTVGKDLEKGMTIGGYFEETQELWSVKFKYAKVKNEKGEGLQYRHVIRVGSPTGDRLGIWNCGELKMAFEKIKPGTFVSFTYKGKGENAKGEDQHFFDFKKGPAAEEAAAQ